MCFLDLRFFYFFYVWKWELISTIVLCNDVQLQQKMNVGCGAGGTNKTVFAWGRAKNVIQKNLKLNHSSKNSGRRRNIEKISSTNYSKMGANICTLLRKSCGVIFCCWPGQTRNLEILQEVSSINITKRSSRNFFCWVLRQGAPPL
jgi:hypothetical protein